jgi:hypothetical protein
VNGAPMNTTGGKLSPNSWHRSKEVAAGSGCVVRAVAGCPSTPWCECAGASPVRRTCSSVRGWRRSGMPSASVGGAELHSPGWHYDCQPRWAPGGFAAIPTTALDPPHRAASPAVSALLGPGPHADRMLSGVRPPSPVVPRS